jgi:hypothetical protein
VRKGFFIASLCLLVFGGSFSVYAAQASVSPRYKIGPLLNRELRARQVVRGGAADRKAGVIKVIVSLGNDYLSELSPDQVDEFTGKVAALGGRVGLHACNNVQVWIADDRIAELSAWPEVTCVSAPIVPRGAGGGGSSLLPAEPGDAPPAVRRESRTLTEGLPYIGADKWQRIGVTGKGVEVAVIDLGFKGFGSLRGSELPADLKAYYFGSPEGALDNVHGTACAEIVHDVAPDASLTLLYAGDMDVDFIRAVDWMLEHGIDVASSSIGFNLKFVCTYMYYVLHGEGSDPYAAAYYLDQLMRKTQQVDAAVAAAVAGGVTWVQSAGNDGRKKWSGLFVDSDLDGFLNFSPAEDYNILDTRGCEGRPVYVMLMWDEIGGTYADYDLAVYDDQFNLVSLSNLPQDSIQTGVEACGFVPQPGVVYRIAVYKDHGRSQNLDLYVGHEDFPKLKYYNNAGTVMLAHPAPVAEAVTVGAVEPRDGRLEIAFYSSQGPGRDGVLKPEVVAPAGVSTVSYGPGRFRGSSAAAPHVAGLCALHKQYYPQDVPAQQKAFLQNTALDYGVSGPDNVYGYGLAHLPRALFFQPMLYFSGLSPNPGDRNCIGVVNPHWPLKLFGQLRACDDSGREIARKEIFLPPGGRQEFPVAETFPGVSGISYLTLSYEGGKACGYTSGVSAAAGRGYMIPALDRASGGDMFIPHIVSDSIWQTRVSLVNAGGSPRNLTLWFDNGVTRTLSLAAKQHRSFLLRELFAGVPQPGIHSAKITGSAGLIGTEVFVGGHYAGGISLAPNVQKDIFFPHVADDSRWWTGLVAYNPSRFPASLRVLPFDASGAPLPGQTVTLPGERKYIGTVESLGLPAATAWFKIESSGEVHSFELFGTSDGKQMAGYSTTGIRTASGNFPRINRAETWTGIAFVNPNPEAVALVIAAQDDNGELLAINAFSLKSYDKIVATAENLFAYNNEDFDPVKMARATHMSFFANAEIIGFELEGSTDGMILESIPAQSIH